MRVREPAECRSGDVRTSDQAGRRVCVSGPACEAAFDENTEDALAIGGLAEHVW